jgi:hypothetical protein
MYTIYQSVSGKITGWSDNPEAPSIGDFGPHRSFLPVDSRPNEEAHYITGSPPTVTARPTLSCTLDKSTITANGLDTATLSGIPSGAAVSVTDQNGTTTYTVNDGTLEITADEPGTITITVTPAFPYQPLTVTVTAS